MIGAQLSTCSRIGNQLRHDEIAEQLDTRVRIGLARLGQIMQIFHLRSLLNT